MNVCIDSKNGVKIKLSAFATTVLGVILARAIEDVLCTPVWYQVLLTWYFYQIHAVRSSSQHHVNVRGLIL